MLGTENPTTSNQEVQQLGLVVVNFVALQQSTIPPSANIKAPQVDVNPMDAYPFTFIDVWSSDSMPSKASKSSNNMPFTHFNEVVAPFEKLVFDQNLEDTLSNPYYKGKLQQEIIEAFKFNDLVVDELHEEIESFLNAINNSFEAHQLYSQHC